MTEDIVQEITQKTLTVVDSKLYAVSRETPLLQALIADIDTQMNVEVEIDRVFPREAEDGDSTRILLNYTNVKGRSSLYKVVDHERLNRVFDIDHFMNGLMMTLQTPDDDRDVTDMINTTLMTALNMSVTTVLGVDTGETASKNTKNVSDIVLKSLTSVLFNDPLDVIVLVNELPLKEGQDESISVVTGMWIVKQRHDRTTENTLH